VPTVLLATDADWIRDEVASALGDATTAVKLVRQGRDVVPAITELRPDLVVLDLQIGNMGGMATCMHIRLESGAARLPDVPVLMLLDRAADVFLAQRCNADGWLIKPLDSLRLKRAAIALMAGNIYTEGVPEDPEPTEDEVEEDGVAAAEESAGLEEVPAS
jgi:DNA-binding response OmpR family regulator